MTKLYKNNVWNSWTKKSIKTPFETTEQAIGDGEQKLGAEFGEKPLGQNISYDLNILGEKWEVKKLDSDNSFRLGVEVSSSYRQIIDSTTRILEQIINMETILVDSKTSDIIKDCIARIKSKSGRTNTLLINGLRKNEVSSANLEKANAIIETVKKLIVTKKKQISLFSSYDGSLIKYDLLTSYNKLLFENIPITEKVKILDCDLNFYSKLQLTSYIGKDILIFKNVSLKEKLNQLVRSIFTDIKLVLVHKDKGYKPITDLNKIYCNRITSGNPRCKILT